MKTFLLIALTFFLGCHNRNSSTSGEFHPGFPTGALVKTNSPTQSFGSFQLGLEYTITLTVQNQGALSVSALQTSAFTVTSSTYFKDGSFPGTGGTCGATVTSGQTCQLVFTFKPPAAGTYSDSISVTYQSDSDGNTRTTDLLAVTGTASAGSSGDLVQSFGTNGILVIPFQSAY